MEVDKETQEVLKEGEKTSDFAKSESWKHVKNILEDRLQNFLIMDDQDLDKKREDEIGKEFKARKFAVDIIKDWIKEVDGSIDAHQANLDALKDKDEENYLKIEE